MVESNKSTPKTGYSFLPAIRKYLDIGYDINLDIFISSLNPCHWAVPHAGLRKS